MNQYKLSAALKTGKGCVRTNNEDAFYFNGKYAELEDMDRETALSGLFLENRALFAVCDGMGGYENGELASYTAVSNMQKLHLELSSSSFSSAVAEWVNAANSAILEIAGEGGCTLAMLFFDSGKISLAHIGDSRIYMLRHGKLSRLTKDHSKIQVLLDAGVITAEEAETHPEKHRITRALGRYQEDSGKCLPDIQESLPAENGDRYMICSDGVTEMLPDSRIESILAEGKNAAECAESIYGESLKAGGKDNTSVIVIDTDRMDPGEKETPGL